MSCWSRTYVVLLLSTFQFAIRVAWAQRFELEVELTRYERGTDEELFLRTCLRESACVTQCSSFESQETILRSPFPPTMITFETTRVGEHRICFDVRTDATITDPSLRFSSPAINTATTEMQVQESFSSTSGNPQTRITLGYRYQVVCAESYFGPSCSTMCTQISGNFICNMNGMIVTCPASDPACSAECEPDLNSCQGTGITVTSPTSQTSTTGQTSTMGPASTTAQTSTMGQTSTTSRTSSTTASSPSEATAIATGQTSATTRSTTTQSGASITVGSGAEGESAGLSRGQVAGIVLPILIITILVVGVVGGLLVWKYQPWHNILRKKSTDDAIGNPVYEMNDHNNPLANGQELTASTFSSPLYSEDTSEDNFTENGALMDIIRMQSAKKRAQIQREPPGVGEPAATAAAVSNGAAACSNTDAAKPVDPYRESFTFGGGDSETGNVYEPVEAPPQPTFDNPDYEAV